MKKKIILQVVSSMDRGGAETFLMNVFREINRDKFEFIFLCYSDRHFDYEDEVNSLGGKVVRVSSPYNILKIVKLIKSLKVDVIHAHTMFGSVYSLLAGVIARVPIRFAHSHSTLNRRNSSFLKRAYYTASGLALNASVTGRLACGVDAGRALFASRTFEVMYNGIDLKKFAYNTDVRKDIRKELGLAYDATVVGHVGRFDEAKNHDYLLEIFSEYLKLNDTAVLVLVGDGTLRGKIEAKIKRLNISSSVKLIGKRSDVDRIYSALDLFLMPSLYEGLPIVLVEAQANGLPCLISDTIAREVGLTSNVVFASLGLDSKSWAHSVDELTRRADRSMDLKAFSDYDIRKTAARLTELYETI